MDVIAQSLDDDVVMSGLGRRLGAHSHCLRE
jgi:hypothetical protein